MPDPTSSVPRAPPTVRLRQGTYIGRTLPASADDALPQPVEAFLGIPFAQSTAGENRFRPPVPLPANPSQTFGATQHGPYCPSPLTLHEDIPAGEDCLNLNVYRPAVVRPGSTKLPVVVYVHGGAFNGGLGEERNMASFVAWAPAETPLVAVNFNYRVGPLGFLPAPLTAREGLLNLGLRDQQCLFRWVWDNIAAFGGDEDNITIMGLSAGAHSIGHHLMYYATLPTPPPFHKAILESGATTARAVLYPSHPRHVAQFAEFLATAGIDAGATPESQILPQLRSLPLDKLLQAHKAVWDAYQPSVRWPFQAVIDGDASPRAPRPAIPDLPIASWRRGPGSCVRGVPVLTGFNANEGTLFAPPQADTNADAHAFFRVLIPALTDADLARFDALYPDPVADPAAAARYVPPPPGFGRQWGRIEAAYSHYAYICPVLQTAHFLAASPAASPGRASPVYVYRYAAAGDVFGAANHGEEAPVVAHDMAAVGRWPGLRAASDAMHGAWVRFITARIGDADPANAGLSAVAPRAGEAALFAWPKFESPVGGGKGGASRLAVFGEGNFERSAPAGGRKGDAGAAVKIVALTDEEVEQCRFWWDRVELSQGMGLPLPAGERAGAGQEPKL